MIYLDNAATTLRKPPQVAEAVVRAMGSMGNSARGTHEGALTASRTIYETRCAVAALFGCPRADHVAFTANSTEALNMALNGLIRAGDHVISTDLEHNSVLRPLYRLRDERGAALDFVPADRQGNIDYADFERLLRPKTRAIVCTHASNLTGNAVALTRVGEIAQRHGVLFLVDASQSAGVLPIDMEKMHIDVLCFTGHKSLMGRRAQAGCACAAIRESGHGRSAGRACRPTLSISQSSFRCGWRPERSMPTVLRGSPLRWRFFALSASRRSARTKRRSCATFTRACGRSRV